MSTEADWNKWLSGCTPNVRRIGVEVCKAAQTTIKKTPPQLWGYNPASVPEHSSRRAIDFMVNKSGGGFDNELGDYIADFIWANRKRFGVKWIIWRRRIRSASPGRSGNWEPMADRGDSTQNHMDHVHAFFDGTYSGNAGVDPTPPTNGGDDGGGGGHTPTTPSTTVAKAIRWVTKEGGDLMVTYTDGSRQFYYYTTAGRWVPNG